MKYLLLVLLNLFFTKYSPGQELIVHSNKDNITINNLMNQKIYFHPNDTDCNGTYYRCIYIYKGLLKRKRHQHEYLMTQTEIDSMVNYYKNRDEFTLAQRRVNGGTFSSSKYIKGIISETSLYFKHGGSKAILYYKNGVIVKKIYFDKYGDLKWEWVSNTNNLS